MGNPSINVYPSTDDAFRPIKGGAHSDETLNVLITARERYAEHGTTGTYVNRGGGSVCALGAVFVGDGKEAAFLEIEGELSTYVWMEKELSTFAIEAIDLLDQVAQEWIDEHHEELDYMPLTSHSYYGPLEMLNERVSNRQRVILEVYDDAIFRRESMVSA